MTRPLQHSDAADGADAVTDAVADAVADRLGRPLGDLRVSVTDRCNFRCAFCMPGDRSYDFLPRREILTFEEATRLVRVATGLGVRKVRLTGGEPLLRSDLEVLVAQLAALPAIDDLALTTNGSLLAAKAAALAAAGLQRVTVSLHSLDPETFARQSGVGVELSRVIAGIDAATAAGLGPVKLNSVVRRGANEHEVLPLVRFARERGATLRFIEYMDVGTVHAWDADQVLSAEEIVARIDAVHPLEPLAPAHRGEVARRYRFRDGAGEVGVIPSITEPFCGDCTRARLSADGHLYTCLFARFGHDLKTPLRAGEDDAALARRLRSIWRGRSDRYSEERTAALHAGTFRPAEKVEMFRIGG